MFMFEIVKANGGDAVPYLPSLFKEVVKNAKTGCKSYPRPKDRYNKFRFAELLGDEFVQIDFEFQQGGYSNRVDVRIDVVTDGQIIRSNSLDVINKLPIYKMENHDELARILALVNDIEAGGRGVYRNNLEANNELFFFDIQRFELPKMTFHTRFNNEVEAMMHSFRLGFDVDVAAGTTALDVYRAARELREQFGNKVRMTTLDDVLAAAKTEGIAYHDAEYLYLSSSRAQLFILDEDGRALLIHDGEHDVRRGTLSVSSKRVCEEMDEFFKMHMGEVDKRMKALAAKKLVTPRPFVKKQHTSKNTGAKKIIYNYKLYVDKDEDGYIMFGGGVGPHASEGTDTDADVFMLSGGAYDQQTINYLADKLGLDGDNNCHYVDSMNEKLYVRNVTVGEIRQVLADCPYAVFQEVDANVAADSDVFAYKLDE